ncbi:hypothetical protein SAMN06265348_105322 [Pedobacter westerhofensis]|uniref:Uncharacterized protein n=1 Tax=Pedobacter westerhofensis TaxID=425512 RepID=A0A521DFF5_9SPHI|nr:hypothetical protein [Pedobacter westerhofensis]SMO70433.1 hypothetical protein SAMN06265348_105322 [Pedobacter westerhofensis]
MAEQLTTSAEALRLFFTDDIYLVKSDSIADVDLPAVSAAAVAPVPRESEQASASVPAQASAPAPETVFKYLGKNQKNVLILVHDSENEVSSESGRALLRNLVKAMQLTANDFALLNYFNYTHVKFEELSKFFNSTLVLGFGVSPVQLGLTDQPQHTIGTHGTIKLVFTGRLDELADDQDGKKKLWSSLKKFTF